MRSLKALLQETEEQYVDLSKIDLQREYRKYAAELFDNDMPVIPIEVRKLSSGAVADATRNKSTGKITPVRIIISSKFKFTPEGFRNVLVHEMIHIWLYHNQIMETVNGGHGPRFQAKMREINAKGFKIETHNHDGKIAVENKKGIYAFLMHRYSDNKYMMMVFTPKQYDEFSKFLFKRYDLYADMYEMNLVLSYDPELLAYPLSRKPETLKRYLLTKDKYESILRNSEPVERAA